ncbi:MAG: hypothetical protein U0Q11_25725 [Vicinamibacterales bacterium]
MTERLQNRHTRPSLAARTPDRFTVATAQVVITSQDGQIGAIRRIGSFQAGI